MPAKEPRKGFIGVLDRLLLLIGEVKGVALILAGLSVGGVSGTLMANDPDTASRVDSLEARLDSVVARQKQSEQQQLEMNSAQIEADSALRGVLERRAENRRKAAESRANTQKLFDEILGVVQ